MTTQTNIIKQACAELGITQKELAERLGVADGTVRKWASGHQDIPEWATKFITLMLESKENNEVIEMLKTIFKRIS